MSRQRETQPCASPQGAFRAVREDEARCARAEAVIETAAALVGARRALSVAADAGTRTFRLSVGVDALQTECSERASARARTLRKRALPEKHARVAMRATIALFVPPLRPRLLKGTRSEERRPTSAISHETDFLVAL